MKHTVRKGTVLTRNDRRFPALSGLNVIWDSRKPPGERVLSVMLQLQDIKGKKALGVDSGYTTPTTADFEGIKRDNKKYKIMTREYMSEGHDGFDVMKKCKYLVDGEQGQMMSSLVRKYLLGLYLNEHVNSFCLYFCRSRLHQEDVQTHS